MKRLKNMPTSNRSRDKAAVEAAVKAKHEGSSENRSGENGNRSGENARTGKALLQGKIDEARSAFSKSIKTQVVMGGIGDALRDIAEGKFDDIELGAINALNIFTEGWEEERISLIGEEVNRPLLPSASSSCPALSLRTIQEDNE
jgi:hypothetical protein